MADESFTLAEWALGGITALGTGIAAALWRRSDAAYKKAEAAETAIGALREDAVKKEAEVLRIWSALGKVGQTLADHDIDDQRRFVTREELARQFSEVKETLEDLRQQIRDNAAERNEQHTALLMQIMKKTPP